MIGLGKKQAKLLEVCEQFWDLAGFYLYLVKELIFQEFRLKYTSDNRFGRVGSFLEVLLSRWEGGRSS